MGRPRRVSLRCGSWGGGGGRSNGNGLPTHGIPGSTFGGPALPSLGAFSQGCRVSTASPYCSAGVTKRSITPLPPGFQPWTNGGRAPRPAWGPRLPVPQREPPDAGERQRAGEAWGAAPSAALRAVRGRRRRVGPQPTPSPLSPVRWGHWPWVRVQSPAVEFHSAVPSLHVETTFRRIGFIVQHL